MGGGSPIHASSGEHSHAQPAASSLTSEADGSGLSLALANGFYEAVEEDQSDISEWGCELDDCGQAEGSEMSFVHDGLGGLEHQMAVVELELRPSVNESDSGQSSQIEGLNVLTLMEEESSSFRDVISHRQSVSCLQAGTTSATVVHGGNIARSDKFDLDRSSGSARNCVSDASNDLLSVDNPSGVGDEDQAVCSKQLNVIDTEQSECRAKVADFNDYSASHSMDHDEKFDRLYKLMMIMPDKQDLSFVEKVIIPQEEVRRLSNDVVPDRARAQSEIEEGKYIIDFKQLNAQARRTIGFYGSKAVMIEILENRNIGLGGSALTKLRQDSLSPGLYAFLNHSFLCVFYWHKGSSTTESSRKDISCNFVRYITDLCDTVYVCVELKEADVNDSLFAAGPDVSKKQRTQRLRVGKEKASEDSAEVSEGFAVKFFSTDSQSHSWTYLEPQFHLSEGLHRVALISATIFPPRVGFYDKQRHVNKDFPSTVEAWYRNFNVDLDKLPAADFKTWLSHSGLKEGDELRKVLKSIETKKREQKNAKYKIEELLESQESLVNLAVSQFLSAYLKIKYPWEVGLLNSNQSTAVLKPEDSLLQKSKTELTPVEPGELQLLEMEVYSSLFTQRPIFPGEKVVLRFPEWPRDSKAGDLKELNWNDCNRFALKPTETGLGTLIMSGRRVFARATNPESRVTSGVTRHEGWNRDAYRQYAGPILSNERLVMKDLPVKHEDRMTDIAIVNVKPHPQEDEKCVGTLQSLVDNMAKDLMPDLFRNAAFLTLLGDNMSVILAQGPRSLLRLWQRDDDKFLRQLLTSSSPVDLLRANKLEPALHDCLESEWAKVTNCGSISQILEGIQIPEDICSACTILFGEFQKNLIGKVQGIFKKQFKPLLQETIKANIEEGFQRVETATQEEERLFLQKVREVFNSQRVSGRRLISVLACTSSDKRQAENLRITYKEEVEGKENVSWKATEIITKKEDLDKLNLDSELQFSPTLSQILDVIQFDPSVQRFVKIVLLKNGHVLLLVHHLVRKELHLFVGSRLGANFTGSNPNLVIKRGLDLVTFEEGSNFFAFYNRETSCIHVATFDVAARKLDWIGADIDLNRYKGSCRLIWMEFVVGRNELAIIDEDHRVRIFEINSPVLLRPKCLNLGPKPFLKACVSSKASCLLILRAREEDLEVTTLQTPEVVQGTTVVPYMESLGLQIKQLKAAHSTNYPSDHDKDADSGISERNPGGLVLDVYKLDGTMAKMDTIQLDLSVKDPSKIQVAVMSFGAQMQLVIHNSDDPDTIFSKVLKITTAAEVCMLRKVNRPSDEVKGLRESKPTAVAFLDYLYHSYDKFSTSPPLVRSRRNINFHIILKSPSLTNSVRLGDKCLQYFNSSLARLQREKGKVFSSLRIHGEVHEIGLWDSPSDIITGNLTCAKEVQMGDWIHLLVCLVPIQVARAENNGLKPLSDGLQLSFDVNYFDAVSLADAIRLGFYEAVLADWSGPVKIISSMGKQSSGKSYLLNHLSGSLLDVAGGRCTDGVWMTMRRTERCLYVLLDFEGLGSFERTEQEDMLLSIFNAAVSNITIFNKKDFNLDKDTEAVFERFQNGVDLVKKDDKLFKGLFYMAIKDVDNADVEDLKTECHNKIFNMCKKSEKNFLTTMYGGEIEVAAMASFNKLEFHECIEEIGSAVEQLEPSFQNGKSFGRDLKLVMAQISAKDWSPIDSKRIALRVTHLRRDLSIAVSIGAIAKDGFRRLAVLDTEDEIPDEPVHLENSTFALCDTGLELVPIQENRVVGDILREILEAYKSIMSRNGENDEKWHDSLDNFAAALADRRKKRVLQWLTLNTADYQNDGDVQRLQLEAVAMLAEMKQSLALCSCKCHRCFLRCTQEKGHPSSHSCMGDHGCKEYCTYCREQGLEESACEDMAGHQGFHDCKERSHTCEKPCHYKDSSSTCNLKCSQKVCHADGHLCNSQEHLCNKFCLLESCGNQCVWPLEHGNHNMHLCHEKCCPAPCSMKGCRRSCGTKDHLHSLKSTVHFCGSVHPCLEDCESPGNCDVLTELHRKTRTFEGKRSSFEYDHVSEQNGLRKGCCIPIPPFQDTHEGPHLHTVNTDAVHYCESRCRCCGYFCTLPIGHSELHDTTHGNMTDVKFVSESEEIDLGDRKYAWGESGAAEMCGMHCKAQGRGHLHLVPCPENNRETCLSMFFREGARHETRTYGPDFIHPKDEMTHATFWKHMRFVDPCSFEDQQLFELCNHECESADHTLPLSGISASLQWSGHKSFCTQKVWHLPLPKSDLSIFGEGYITDDGHHFECEHSKHAPANIIFVIDKSSSMSKQDMQPNMVKFAANNNNRLGCVFEAILNFVKIRLLTAGKDIVSVVLFDWYAQIVIDLQEMKESVVDVLLTVKPGRGTRYSSGLTVAEDVLLRASHNPNFGEKGPVIIFLSDGGNSPDDNMKTIGCIQKMVKWYPDLIVHTIMFGKASHGGQLIRMKDAGSGTFQLSLDDVELVNSFKGLAHSLRPQVSSLVYVNDYE